MGTAAAEQLRTAVRALLDTPLAMLGSDELLSLVGELEVLRRQLEAADAAVLAETQARLVDPAAVLICQHQVAPAAVRRRVALAEVVAPRHAVSGEVLAPVLPRTAAA